MLNQYQFSMTLRKRFLLNRDVLPILGNQKIEFPALSANPTLTVIIAHKNGQKYLLDTLNTISIQSILSVFDYDLKDDSQYLIMELEFGNKSAERIESTDIASNQKFAVIIYDSNEPDNIQNYNSTLVAGNPVQIGLSRPPGRLKALKGTDFDKKIVTFTPPITLENFKISFYKYDNTYYNFNNREHMLTFEIDVADYDPSYRY